MRPLAILATLALTACPPGNTFSEAASIRTEIPVTGEAWPVGVTIDGLTQDELENVYTSGYAEYSDVSGLHLQVIPDAPQSGQVEISLDDSSLHLFRVRDADSPDRDPRVVDSSSFSADGEHFVVRIIDDSICTGGEPCLVYVPLILTGSEGAPSSLGATIRFGVFDAYGDPVSGISLSMGAGGSEASESASDNSDNGSEASDNGSEAND